VLDTVGFWQGCMHNDAPPTLSDHHQIHAASSYECTDVRGAMLAL
jgi:hypothetical protein